ncbi:hypothetical protein H4R19_000903 [Coemansia spiralis]|nr:hypothetical protein H4R19_000903 [Coemansia spiralis]
MDSEVCGESSTAAAAYDPLAHLSVDASSPGTPASAGTSHPPIFRQGTVVDIIEGPSTSPPVRKTTRERTPARKQRLVAICIKDEAQAEYLTCWALQNELVVGRDNVILVNVRRSAMGMLGDLTGANGTTENDDRVRSHALLRKHAALVKQEGFAIKGVSIRGTDVRGEIVCKMIELKCDLVVIGGSTPRRRSIRDRLRRHKEVHVLENSPCPVLFVPPAPGHQARS